MEENDHTGLLVTRLCQFSLAEISGWGFCFLYLFPLLSFTCFTYLPTHVFKSIHFLTIQMSARESQINI